MAETRRKGRRSSEVESELMSPTALRHEIGRLIIAGFHGHQLPVEVVSLSREFGLGGVILFSRNVEDALQVAELCHQAARLAPDAPLWVSVDQEGGRVARLKAPFTEWPPMATLGRSGDARLAEAFGGALAAELRAVGVNLDYAPVLDVHTNPRNPVIGDRAIASEAAEVARLGAAIVRGLQGGGVAACGKHFPGHGDTITDSHLELPIVEHPIEDLRTREFVPFRAAIDAEVSAIMTAHVFAPALDEERPATLSHRIVTGLLREELHYEGVVLSDDLEMKAIAKERTVPVAAVMAIEAGCDGLLICSGNYDLQAAAAEALVHAVEDGQLAITRVEQALKRHDEAKQRFLTGGAAAPPRASGIVRQILGCDRHRTIAAEMARYL
jgi:beta-N-acetylhexosaminidase